MVVYENMRSLLLEQLQQFSLAESFALAAGPFHASTALVW